MIAKTLKTKNGMIPTTLIAVTGLPGTGKTTFASALAAALGVKHINSDMVRHSLGKKGQYDRDAKAAVYDELLKQTEEYLKNRISVIVDSTFYKEELRKPYKDLSLKYTIPIKWIELKTDEKIIKNRVNKKRKYSEADFEVYLLIKQQWEPLTDHHLILQSDQLSTEKMMHQTLEYLK